MAKIPPLKQPFPQWLPRSHSGAPRAILIVKTQCVLNSKIRGASREQGASTWATLSSEIAVFVLAVNGLKFTLIRRQDGQVS